MTTPRPDSLIGTDLGPYRIEAVVGRGGMGVVYRATDTKLDRPVALKLLAPDFVDDEGFRARFLRESRMAAAIDHPNIIPIYEAGEIARTFYLAMRFVEGTDLATRLRSGPLEPRAAVSILAQVASALDAAHAAGLVHRDVKPANLLIASGHSVDRADHVYLTDFGLTKQRGSQTGLTRTGSFLGTLEYVAPEQIEGKPVDGRADQYALAAIAVECLTGEGPFPRDSDLAIVNAHLRDAPPSIHLRRPTLPAAVDAVITRGLAKEPADRYPDCQAFVEDLRDALGITGSQPRPLVRASGRDRRAPLLIGVLAVVGLLVVAVAVAGRGGLGPIPSAPAGVGAGPSASAVTATAAPATTDDAFPSVGEAALLAVIPDGLAATCARGPYNVVESEGGGGTPNASLRCPQDISSGANEVIIRRFRPLSDLRGGNQGFNTDSVISMFTGDFGGPNPIPPGDCATAANAGGRWTRGGSDAGAIVCFRDTATGDAILYWSDQGAQILGKAVNQRGDSAALYGWFDKNAMFIGP